MEYNFSRKYRLMKVKTEEEEESDSDEEEEESDGDDYDGEEEYCDMCGEIIGKMGSTTYKFSDKDFTVHQSCSIFPLEMKHPFHPHHSLSLLPCPPYESSICRCDACGHTCSGFVFHCSQCNFDLHFRCVSSLKPYSMDDRPITNCHFFQKNQHPLIMCKFITEDDSFEKKLSTCSCCQHNLQGGNSDVYVCLECSYLLHLSCHLHFPAEINHQFHPQHPLRLLLSNNIFDCIKCNLCNESVKGFAYFCQECDIYFDAPCASLLLNASVSSKKKHSYCSNSLISCPNEMDFQFSCSACELPFQLGVDLIYACLQCQMLLHESCADLPTQINQHPFHPHDTLKLVDRITDKQFQASMCRSCSKSIKGSYYVCPSCKTFRLHVECALPFPPTINLAPEVHQHPLALIEDMFKFKLLDNECETCGGRIHDSPFFACLKCWFHVHVECITILPPTGHTYHLHPLTLTYSPIRDDSDDDENTELYCDSCEERRDLFLQSYYCDECHYVAHVECVFSESQIISWLRENGHLVQTINIEDVDVSVASTSTNVGEAKLLTISELSKGDKHGSLIEERKDEMPDPLIKEVETKNEEELVEVEIEEEEDEERILEVKFSELQILEETLAS